MVGGLKVGGIGWYKQKMGDGGCGRSGEIVGECVIAPTITTIITTTIKTTITTTIKTTLTTIPLLGNVLGPQKMQHAVDKNQEMINHIIHAIEELSILRQNLNKKEVLRRSFVVFCWVFMVVKVFYLIFQSCFCGIQTRKTNKQKDQNINKPLPITTPYHHSSYHLLPTLSFFPFFLIPLLLLLS